MRFLLTCGGTAGHINPAIAVADRVRELMPDAEILFVGGDGNMELELVPRAGYKIEAITASSLRRGMKPADICHNFMAAFRNCNALAKSKRIVKKFLPDVAIGTGGYVCYPVIRMAAKLGVATVIHEANALPGLTTRLLEKHCGAILVSYDESRKYYHDPDKVKVVGMPIRGSFFDWDPVEAKKQLGVRTDKPLVVSFWGSLGASHMNELTAELIAENEQKSAFYHIHATGNGDEGIREMRHRLSALDVGELKYTELRPYIYDMARVMASADLVLCRAGASTLGELYATATPAILVPSKNVTNDHQEKNASVPAARGGAILVHEAESTGKSLFGNVLEAVSDSGRLHEMGRIMREMGNARATDSIISASLGLIE